MCFNTGGIMQEEPHFLNEQYLETRNSRVRFENSLSLESAEMGCRQRWQRPPNLSVRRLAGEPRERPSSERSCTTAMINSR